jgi:hypothetical protein
MESTEFQDMWKRVDERTPKAAGVHELAVVLAKRDKLVAHREGLARWRWIRRRALADSVAVETGRVLFWAPQAVAAAHEAVATADAARRWGRTELRHPRQHVREAAAALLEAIGQPVAEPGPGQLLSDLVAVMGAPDEVSAWDDLARRLKTRRPERYPVLTGTQLRQQALVSGVRELALPGPVRQRGTSYEAVVAAQEAAR